MGRGAQGRSVWRGDELMSTAPKFQQYDLFGTVEAEPVGEARKPLTQKTMPCKRRQSLYLSDVEVAKLFRISKATVWRWHNNNPCFPRRINLSPGT